MREMSVKDIQNVSLDILRIIDDFCVENQIQYSLGYGALIGAVRHGGCIPWDDDIDIIMTRSEYETFYKKFNQSIISEKAHVKLFAPELGNCFFPISRVCDMRRTKVYKWYQWTNENTGVWIDVFVIDATERSLFKDLVLDARKACRGHVVLSSDLTMLQNIKNVAKRVLWSNYSRQRIINKYLEMIQQSKWDDMDIVCNVVSPYDSDVHSKSVFDNYKRIYFEGQETSIITDFDTYLKKIYGDYMTLPPLEKRQKGHTLNKYWWL